MPSSAPRDGDPLRAVLRNARLSLPASCRRRSPRTGGALGDLETVMSLVDGELLLQRLRGQRVPERQELGVDGSRGGPAPRRVEVLASPAHAVSRRLWMPLIDGVQRLGMMEFVVEDVSVVLAEEKCAYAGGTAALLVVQDADTDVSCNRAGARRSAGPRRSGGTCCRR